MKDDATRGANAALIGSLVVFSTHSLQLCSTKHLYNRAQRRTDLLRKNILDGLAYVGAFFLFIYLAYPTTSNDTLYVLLHVIPIAVGCLIFHIWNTLFFLFVDARIFARWASYVIVTIQLVTVIVNMVGMASVYIDSLPNFRIFLVAQCIDFFTSICIVLITAVAVSRLHDTTTLEVASRKGQA